MSAATQEPAGEVPVEHADGADPDAVELRVPASSAYLVLLRTAVGALCARLDFTLERLDDLRLAVDEAASLLLAETEPGGDLRTRFLPSADGAQMVVEIAARTTTGRAPSRGTFSWTVLTALVDEVHTSTDGHDVTVRLTSRGGGLA